MVLSVCIEIFHTFSFIQISSVKSLCKLHDSGRLKRILQQINEYMKQSRKSFEMIGNVESDPEYQLIVEVNSVAVEIDNEICKFLWHSFGNCFTTFEIIIINWWFSFCFTAIIHKFTKNKYQKRFPELDSLIVGELEYLMAVKELGNDLDRIKNNEQLQQILTQATIMIVSVTASTTQGYGLKDGLIIRSPRFYIVSFGSFCLLAHHWLTTKSGTLTKLAIWPST